MNIDNIAKALCSIDETYLTEFDRAAAAGRRQSVKKSVTVCAVCLMAGLSAGVGLSQSGGFRPQSPLTPAGTSEPFDRSETTTTAVFGENSTTEATVSVGTSGTTTVSPQKGNHTCLTTGKSSSTTLTTVKQTGITTATNRTTCGTQVEGATETEDERVEASLSPTVDAGKTTAAGKPVAEGKTTAASDKTTVFKKTTTATFMQKKTTTAVRGGEIAEESVYRFAINAGVYVSYEPGKVIENRQIGDKLSDVTVTAGWQTAGVWYREEPVRAVLYQIRGISDKVAVALRFVDKPSIGRLDCYYVMSNPSADRSAVQAYLISPSEWNGEE